MTSALLDYSCSRLETYAVQLASDGRQMRYLKHRSAYCRDAETLTAIDEELQRLRAQALERYSLMLSRMRDCKQRDPQGYRRAVRPLKTRLKQQSQNYLQRVERACWISAQRRRAAEARESWEREGCPALQARSPRQILAPLMRAAESYQDEKLMDPVQMKDLIDNLADMCEQIGLRSPSSYRDPDFLVTTYDVPLLLIHFGQEQMQRLEDAGQPEDPDWMRARSLLTALKRSCEESLQDRIGILRHYIDRYLPSPLTEDAAEHEQLVFALYILENSPLLMPFRPSKGELESAFAEHPEGEKLLRAFRLARRGWVNVPAAEEATKLRQQVLEAHRSYFQQRYPDRTKHEVAVSGAGPSGLMHALSAYALGYKVHVYDKRPETAFDPLGPGSRKNVLALGKTDNTGHIRTWVRPNLHIRGADIRLLEYFGVTARLENPMRVTKEQWYEVRIIDLQNAMMSAYRDQCAAESWSEVISFDTSMPPLAKDDATARTHFVCEGLGSSSRVELGGTWSRLTHREQLAFSSFEPELEEADWPRRIKRLWVDAKLLLRSYGTLLQERVSSQYPELSGEQAFLKRVIEGIGAAPLLLEVPHPRDLSRTLQYLYLTVPRSLLEQVRHLDARLSDLQRRHALESEAGRLSKLRAKILRLQDERKQLYQSLAETHYHYAAAFLKREGNGRYDGTTTAWAQVMRAEPAARRLGAHNYALVVGDAVTQTDPVSGSGASRALSSTIQSSQALLTLPGLSLSTAEEQVYVEIGLHYLDRVNRSMRECGIASRQEIYSSYSERPERYLDIAVHDGYLSQAEAEEYLEGRNELRFGDRAVGLQLLEKFHARLRARFSLSDVSQALEESSFKGGEARRELIQRTLGDYLGGKGGSLDEGERRVLLRCASRLASCSFSEHPLAEQPYGLVSWLLYFSLDR